MKIVSEDRRSKILTLIVLSFSFHMLNLSRVDVDAQDIGNDLTAKQESLAEEYKLLENKLYSLFEYEQANNPDRSLLLKKAFQQSQEKQTINLLRSIVEKLQQSDYRGAIAEQKTVLADLEGLLILLQKEERGKRLRDRLARHKRYLAEVDRIRRIQSGIRNQAEMGASPDRLANSQRTTADRTSDLAEEIRTAENLNGNAQPDSSTEPSGPRSPGQDGGTNDAPSESPSLESRIRSASQKMRQAQKSLDDAQKSESIEQMKIAESELLEAKKELEQILRQMREEEIGRTLAGLESRFRMMLEKEVRIHDSTKKLESVDASQRKSSFEIEATRLANEQAELASEASKALMILREDGTSVAFTVMVEQLQFDMNQISDRLATSNVGLVTQQLEEEVIESLDYFVKALVRTQEQNKTNQQQQAQQPAQAGDQRLVDQIAELKMLQGLQERVHKRHQRYARLADDAGKDPDDPYGVSQRPDIRAALDRLGTRQAQLVRIARDIVNGQGE